MTFLTFCSRVVDRLPDLRAWVATGLFGLTAYVLHLMSSNPALANSQLFTALATAIVVSGLIGGVVAFLYGSSKSSQAKDQTIADMAANASPNPNPQVQPDPQKGQDQ